MTFSRHITQVRNRAAFVLGRLHPLINKKSKMSLRNKLTLYKTCIRPIMTYASVAFAHCRPPLIKRLQTIQNRFLRKAVGAPWYMRNVDLHSDFQLPSIKEHMTLVSRRYFDSAPHHPNPLVVKAASYTPCSLRAKWRRPRSVLTDPPDMIAAALADQPPRPCSQTDPIGNNTLHTTNNRSRRRDRRIPASAPLPGRISPIPLVPVAAQAEVRSPRGSP